MQWDDETFTELESDPQEEVEQHETYDTEDTESPQDHEEMYEEQDPLELTQAEENLLGTAMIRLDQARLYEMLVKHDLFEGVSANPIALKAVQKEIKTFIMNRLEILLGLKSDSPKAMQAAGQFNDIEVQALKDLAFAATKGASRQQREILNPVSNSNARNTLKPISQKQPVTLQKTNTSPSPSVTKQTRAPQPQVAKQGSVKKKKTNNDFVPLDKKIHEMSSEELLARAKQNSDIYKGRTAVNPQALPQPTFEQQMLQYSTALSSNGVGSALMKKLGGSGVYDVGDGE